LAPFTAETRGGYCVIFGEAVVHGDGPNRDREEAPMPKNRHAVSSVPGQNEGTDPMTKPGFALGGGALQAVAP